MAFRSSSSSWFGDIHRAGVIAVGDGCRKRTRSTILSSGAGKDGSRFISPINTKRSSEGGIQIAQNGVRGGSIAEDAHRIAEAEGQHLIIAYASGGVLEKKHDIICCILRRNRFHPI